MPLKLAIFLGGLTIVTLAPFSARAAGCSNLATQMEMNQCAGREQDTLDVELTASYSEIQRRLKQAPDTSKLLTTAQRAWIAFRDTECAFSSAGVEGGSIRPLIVSLCQQKLTQARIGDFKALLTCKEGDLSCPVPIR